MKFYTTTPILLRHRPKHQGDISLHHQFGRPNMPSRRFSLEAPHQDTLPPEAGSEYFHPALI